MPPKRSHGKLNAVTSSNPERVTRSKRNNVPTVESEGSTFTKVLSMDIWQHIISYATYYEEEIDVGPNTLRARACIGLIPTEAERVASELQRSVALETRRSIMLVNKAWFKIGKRYIYSTFVVSESNRPRLYGFLAKMLAEPEIGHTIQRIELKHNIQYDNIEAMAMLIRNFMRNCPNVHMVIDSVSRVGYKRGVSPVEVGKHAALEIPYALALGNRKYQTIDFASFSPDSVAALQGCVWVNGLLTQLPNIEILSLKDYSGWETLGISRKKESEKKKGAKTRKHIRGDDDSEDDNNGDDNSGDEADDEEEKLQPLEFPYLHTLDISRLPTKAKKQSKLLTEYLAGWKVPAVTQLGCSIYNTQSLPTVFLKSIGDTLQKLYLHHFQIDRPLSRITLPHLHTLIVDVPNCMQWPFAFYLPSVERYIMTFSADPKWFSQWRFTVNHLTICADSQVTPKLQEVILKECYFAEAGTWKEDVRRFWGKWSKIIEERGVKLISEDGLSWSEAMENYPFLARLYARKETDDESVSLPTERAIGEREKTTPVELNFPYNPFLDLEAYTP